MNNYEKIKGMNLKELAKFLIGPADTIRFCRDLPECGRDLALDKKIPDERCVRCMMLWLEKEEK